MENDETPKDFGAELTPPHQSPMEKIEFSEDSENDSDRSKYSGETTEDDDDEDEDYQSFIESFSYPTQLKV